MAQEAQKKYPDKVKKQGGKLTVDPSIMPVQGFEDGSANVQPNWDDVPDDTFDGAASPSPMDNIAKILGGGHMAKAMGGQTPASPQTPNIPLGWGAPCQVFLVSGFAGSINKVPKGPTVPGALAGCRLGQGAGAPHSRRGGAQSARGDYARARQDRAIEHGNAAIQPTRRRWD